MRQGISIWASAAGRRIPGRHVRELEKSRLKQLTVPAGFLIGRALGEDVINQPTGELLAQANDVVTQEIIDKLFAAGIGAVKTIYTNDLDQGPYIADTLRLDPTPEPPEAPSE